jgi:phage terminase large subunit-like protein
MLHKGRSKGRIDGAVALGMAFAAQLTMPEQEKSAYASRGIITL